MKPKKTSDLIAETPVTYETYTSLPEDGHRYEVANGRLELMSPAPSPTHQSLSNNLVFLLNSGAGSIRKT
ncbi:Uma2 family endonuclease [Paenibacillus sp.]|uniref:Uma2 family endonuclease n=1 Tax=Paenibacillus sp. TaxID=58172 RepID=UPI002811912D|nr:Uma2 family endonuclease [Paenibacillus sp.]